MSVSYTVFLFACMLPSSLHRIALNWALRGDRLLVFLFVSCITSQQHASVSQGRICSDCCHTQTEAADQNFYLNQSQYTAFSSSSSHHHHHHHHHHYHHRRRHHHRHHHHHRHRHHFFFIDDYYWLFIKAGPSSTSADPMTPWVMQDSHWSTNL